MRDFLTLPRVDIDYERLTFDCPNCPAIHEWQKLDGGQWTNFGVRKCSVCGGEYVLTWGGGHTEQLVFLKKVES